jgi:quercetin dioxygenase-like cupin family protein
MQLVRPTEIAAYDADHFVAVPILSGTHSNVRMIRLSPGQALPPHTHGTSDLFLYVAEGAGELDTPNGPVPLAAGDLAQYRGDEELRVANTASEGLTLLAFLAPPFPPSDAP